MNQYDKRHLANVRRYQRRIDDIYKKATEEAAARAASLPVPDDYIFTFDDFPAVKLQIEALMAEMRAEIELTVADGVRTEWDLANEKNDALVNSVLGDAAKLARYHRTHEAALGAFLKRKQHGLGLSDRVWKYTSQFKDEIEMGLDLGIREGMDAASIARSIQRYLKFPDMLFRRVKDEHGVFQLSQRAAAFHPGQGVYRSSYKNALRLAATETNIAYRTADHERWQDFDFVVGIEVHLSNNHTIVNHKKERVPLFDICDELQGRYPKEFKFTGWHPNCRCIAVTITKTKDEVKADMERIRNGEQPSDPSTSENYVGDMPDNFNTWMQDNAERIERAKSLPYFIRDNFKDGDPSAGLRWMSGVTAVEEPRLTAKEIAEQRHAARTPEQVQAIQDAWDIRRADNNISSVPDIYWSDMRELIKDKDANAIRKLADIISRYENETLIDYAPAMAKKNKNVFNMLDELDKQTGLDRMLQIYKIKKECSSITIARLEKCGATNGLMFYKMDTSYKLTGVGNDVRIDMLWFMDARGKRFAYPIGATKDSIEFSAAKASRVIQSMPRYLQDNVDGVVFAGRNHPLDEYYQKIYGWDKDTRGAMYSSDPVTVHTKYYTMEGFRDALTHEISHHIDLKVRFRYDNAMQAEWAKAVTSDNGYPTNYAKTNSTEDFAESMMCYLRGKREFKKKYPNRTKILERVIKKVNGGKLS